jgi:hypothetical protein
MAADICVGLALLDRRLASRQWSQRASRRARISRGPDCVDHSARVAYPFGALADQIDHRLQLGIGTAILIGADLVLAGADNVSVTALGAAFGDCRWG